MTIDSLRNSVEAEVLNADLTARCGIDPSLVGRRQSRTPRKESLP